MKSKEFDPLSSFPALEEKIAKGAFPPFLFFVAGSRGGFEKFYSEEIFRIAKKRIENEKDWELFSHDPESESFRLASLLGDLQSPSLFASRKLILLRRADSLCRKSAQSKEVTAFEKAILSLLKDKKSAGKNCCFMVLENLRSTHPFLEEAQENGANVFECRSLYSAPPPWIDGDAFSPTEVEKWIGLRATRRKLNLTPVQRKQLVTLRASDLAAIEGDFLRFELDPNALLELSKINPALKADLNPRDFVDAFFQQNWKKALPVLERLFTEGFVDWNGDRIQGSALFPILSAMLTQEVRKLLQVKLQLEKKASVEKLFEEWKLKPYAQRILLSKLQRLSVEQLRAIYSELVNMEREFKQGRNSDPQLAMEKLLFSNAR